MVGIATSYRLDGPGSISRYFQFSIPSVFLCINVFALCTTYELLLISIASGHRPFAVGNKYINLVSQYV
jgi:hypothetical protein